MEKAEQRLNILFKECLDELKSININLEAIGNVNIKISTRATKRYGCCKQEDPDKKTRYIENYKIKYGIFKKHIIEISSWVMRLNDDIIKNTIMHEIIHCMPYCNNHGKVFKKYAKYINENLGYNISRVGNRSEDSINSNIEYKETYKYKITCKKCGQTFFRHRISRNFIKKYRCGKCAGKLIKSEI